MKFWNKRSILNSVTAITLIIIICNMYGTSKLCEKLNGGNNQEFYIVSKEAYHDQDVITYKDIQEITNRFPDIKTTYANEMLLEIDKDIRVKVIGTNENYLTSYDGSLKKGRFLVKNHYIEDQIVLDEEIAFKLFNTSNCIGEKVELKGDIYKVVGIIEHSDSVFGKAKMKDSISNVYIPITKFHQYKEEAIKDIFVRVKASGELEAKKQVTQMLTVLKKDITTFEIISLTKYRLDISNKLKTLIGLLEISFAICLYVGVFRDTNKIYKRLKEKITKYYLTNYLYKNKKLSLAYLIKWIVLLSIASIALKSGIERLIECSTYNITNIVAVNLTDSINALKNLALFNAINLVLGSIIVGVTLLSYLFIRKDE